MNRRFNRAIIAFTVLLVGAVMVINLSIDPFAVFGTSSLPDGPSSNERYRKIQHLINSHGSYTHLIFGSSRSGMTDPVWIDLETGDRTYNLSVFSAGPSDMRKLYQAYRDINGPPRAVTVGIDAMAFLSEPDDADLSRRHHPRTDQAPRVSYWLDYLLAPSLVPILDKLAARTSPNITFDWHNGTYALVGKNRAIDQDHRQYMSDTFDSWVPRNFAAELDVAEWQALLGWLAELAADEVEVTVFLQPMHRQWQQRMAPLMPQLRPLLAAIPGLIDLSNLGADDNRLWYEQRHYRPALARHVVEVLHRPAAQVDPETGSAAVFGVALNKLEGK